MATPYLSEIKLFSFGFPPLGWALCAGQLLPINQNQALFALIGTTYGGNGQTTFALPDLQGRAPVCFGQGTGQSYTLGERGGSETVTLVAAEMPSHAHTVDVTKLTGTLSCAAGTANQRGPAGAGAANEAQGVTATYNTSTPDALQGATAIAPAVTVSTSGSSSPHENRQPYLTLNYCIALQGIFPSQS